MKIIQISKIVDKINIDVTVVYLDNDYLISSKS